MNRVSRAGKAYARSRRRLQKLFRGAEACFTGFWLGVLKVDALHEIDAQYYDDAKAYAKEAYNRRGLSPWERKVIDEHFQHCTSLLVGAVGGGREVLALRRLGYDADGFECHPRLVASANELLENEGLAPNVQLAARDQCPTGAGKSYDGLIVGWGGYMLIQGRDRRTSFLRQLRERARPHAPLLVSFFHRSGQERRFKVIATIGNALRKILGREELQTGDGLAPNYVHHFTEPEIASEFREAGFELKSYAEKPYGHAVGVARDAPNA